MIVSLVAAMVLWTPLQAQMFCQHIQHNLWKGVPAPAPTPGYACKLPDGVIVAPASSAPGATP